MKLEITLVFSIVDAIFGKKDTTDMTSCNGWNRKVRQQSKKTGKIMGKSTQRAEKQQEKSVEQVIYFMH